MSRPKATSWAALRWTLWRKLIYRARTPWWLRLLPFALRLRALWPGFGVTFVLFLLFVASNSGLQAPVSVSVAVVTDESEVAQRVPQLTDLPQIGAARHHRTEDMVLVRAAVARGEVGCVIRAVRDPLPALHVELPGASWSSFPDDPVARALELTPARRVADVLYGAPGLSADLDTLAQRVDVAFANDPFANSPIASLSGVPLALGGMPFLVMVLLSSFAQTISGIDDEDVIAGLGSLVRLRLSPDHGLLARLGATAVLTLVRTVRAVMWLGLAIVVLDWTLDFGLFGSVPSVDVLQHLAVCALLTGGLMCVRLAWSACVAPLSPGQANVGRGILLVRALFTAPLYLLVPAAYVGAALPWQLMAWPLAGMFVAGWLVVQGTVGSATYGLVLALQLLGFVALGSITVRVGRALALLHRWPTSMHEVREVLRLMA